MKHLFLISFFIFSISSAQAKTETASERAQRLQTIKDVAQAYHVQKQIDMMAKTIGASAVRVNVNCGPSSPASCVDVVCAHLGTFGCDDQSEIQSVAGMCKGNFNGGCIDTVCKKLGSFGCDDKNELAGVALACKSNLGGDCITAVCDKLGSFGCDDHDELVKVAGMCGGVEGSCVDSVCAKLGSFGCDDVSELVSVTDSCRP